MSQFEQTIVNTQESILATNKVLKNTYILLSITLIFTAIMAYVATLVVPYESMQVVSFATLIAAVVVLWFVLPRYEESAGIGGLVVTFLFTGLLGFSLGPMLGAISAGLPGGNQIIATALGGTGVIFLALSAYVLTTKKDFSFMAGFLFAGVFILLAMMIVGFIFQMEALQVAISAGFLLISSGLILYKTSAIIHGGEDNYISACVGLYVSIYNIFVSLLHLLMVFSGND